MTTVPIAITEQQDTPAQRWPVILRVARQEILETLFGWGIYITATLGLLLALLLIYNSVRFVGESGLSIISRPFFLPVLVATGIALLYVTVSASLIIARAREQGSLLVLFFAPVDAPSVVGAYWLAGVATYILLLLLLVPALLLLAYVTNFVIPGALLWGLLPTIVIGGLSVAFGLFVSAIAPSGRAAVIFLVAVTLLLLTIQAGYIALLNIPPTSRYYDALLFARELLRTLRGLLLWLTPFQMLDQALSAALRRDGVTILQVVLAASGGIVIWLLAAMAALRRRGVLP